MKYLENERLESLSAFLSNREMGGRMLNGRLEVERRNIQMDFVTIIKFIIIWPERHIHVKGLETTRNCLKC